jgi:uncharacterized phiE125 gp8 family phage protein
LIRITLQSIYIGGDIVPEWRFGGELEKVKPKYQEISISDANNITHEPVDLEEMKNYLKIDYDTDDDLIESLIMGARKQVEDELGGIAIIQREFVQKFTGAMDRIELLRQPVQSISSVIYYEYFESTGQAITSYRRVNHLLYHEDSFWKIGRDADGYIITFIAGLVADEGQSHRNVPRGIRAAIERIVAYLYENREDFATSINEGNFSITYDKNLRRDINLLLMPYHSGKGIF